MIIGIPKEIKDQEYRVAITPVGVSALAQAGHQVLIEEGAGVGSGITDDEYKHAGAYLSATAGEIYAAAELIVKVDEPQPAEYPLLRKGQILFSFLHLAASRSLTEALLDSGCTCIAYETIQDASGRLPLLTPMSEIAGRMSVQIGAQYLERSNGGRGILLSGVPGVPPANVVIVGGGIAGCHAAKMALGMGAYVTVIEKSLDRIRELDDMLHGRIQVIHSNAVTIARSVVFADLLIGAVLVVGAKAPKIVTSQMVRQMRPRSVIVDIAVDQGGCIETIKPTTHSDPVYKVFDVTHYGVANIPGAVPRTSTYALTNATLPYIQELAEFGYPAALARNLSLGRGLNVVDGRLTNEAVAQAHNLTAAGV